MASSSPSEPSREALVEEWGEGAWEGFWSEGVKPGESFDAETSAPALKELMAGAGLPEGTAFVPGCGRGYDIETLASADRHVTGLEISASATAAAEEYLSGVPGLDAKWYKMETGDFFTHKGQYDLVYDYTFSCAIPSQWRGEWATQMAALVKPGGTLATLIFPVLPDGATPTQKQLLEDRPCPWSVADMTALLEGAGFAAATLAQATASFPGREGKEWMATWTRGAK